MNQKIKELWINALRSGEYKQSHHALRTQWGYCCLGVLCDLAATAGIGSWDGGLFRTSGGTIHGELPTAVINWAEVNSRNPDTTRGSLAKMNDTGASFEEIADIIEKEL